MSDNQETDRTKPARTQAKRKSTSEDSLSGETASSPEVALPVAKRTISKTPMFTASNAARYNRQTLIKSIEKQSGESADLICYVSSNGRQIDRDDTLGFVDLLHNIPSGRNIDLLLHTNGGDIDAAQKLIELVLARLRPSGKLRVIVPDYAKSAGTLMALGADEIIMSDSSELGMIDPQFTLKDERGNDITTSVVAYVQTFDFYSEAVRKNPEDPVAAAMLSQFDPIVVRKFQGYRDRARDIAMKMLNRTGGESTRASSALMDIDRWKSHNQMIGYEDAKEIGLSIRYIPPDDNLWQTYWHLYCLQRLEVEGNKKIFESSFVSQMFD